jgi:hypothetical protein
MQSKMFSSARLTQAPKICGICIAGNDQYKAVVADGKHLYGIADGNDNNDGCMPRDDEEAKKDSDVTFKVNIFHPSLAALLSVTSKKEVQLLTHSSNNQHRWR